jgi:hydroxypyruvate isomerase
MGMKWSLNTYQTGQNWELDELIRQSKAAGFDGIEFLMDFKQKHGVEANADAAWLRTVKEKVDASGLEFASVTSCASFHSLDDAERAEAMDRARNTIRIARDFGCRHVRVLGDRVPEDNTRATVLRNVTDCIRELARLAQADGITVAMEMHGSFTDPDLSVPLAEAVDMPNFGLVFNSQFRENAETGWRLPPGGSIRPLYDRFRPHLTQIHTHQMERPDQLPMYQELFRLLKADGWDGYVAMEGAYTGPDPEKVLRLYTALFQTMAA